jgi:cytidylate kinase
LTDRVIALGGPPGSGKTTAAKTLVAHYGLVLVSAGERFRAEARRHGLDLEAFSKYAETHPEVDRVLDESLVHDAKPGQLLEGRLQGSLLRQRGIPEHWLSVTARSEVRAERIARRDKLPIDEATRRMRLRETSEHARYRALYGIDLDQERPDLVVDSSEMDPAAVVAALVRYLEAAGVAGGR